MKSSDTDRVNVDRSRRRRLQLSDLERRRAVVLRRKEKRRNLGNDGSSDVTVLQYLVMFFECTQIEIVEFTKELLYVHLKILYWSSLGYITYLNLN